jgi:hypothetical protein
MKKEAINPMPAYFDRYINKTDDVTLSKAIAISLQEIDAIPLEQWKAIGDRVYAPGKWTIKDIVQHLIDTDRVFTYRALAFARGEKGQVLSYDEDQYAREADTSNRTLEDLIAELKLVRRSFQVLFESFSPEVLLRTGRGFSGEYSVLSIGFMMPGHLRWHMDVIKEKYLPLIS